MTISNQIEGFKEASEAGKAWIESKNKDGNGDALATYAMVTAWSEFEGTYKVDDTEHTFTLSTYSMPLLNAQGARDNKRTGARTAAIGQQLFGLPVDENGKLEARFAMRINRAYQAASYLIGIQAPVDTKRVKTREGMANMLVVPFTAIEAAPDEKASEKEKVLYRVMAESNQPVVLDGRDGMSFANLGKRADAWLEAHGKGKDKRGTKNKSDKGLSFDDAITFALKTVKDWNATDGESDVAPSPGLRVTLFQLSEQLAMYFANDPMKGEERKSA